jgi:hypothetical protein
MYTQLLLAHFFVTASASISRPRRSSSFTQLLCCHDMNEISWYHSISTQRKFHRLPALFLFCCLRSLLCYVRCTTLYISCQYFIRRYFSDICNPFDKWKQAQATLPRGRPARPGLKGFRPSLFRKVDVRGVKLGVLVCRIDTPYQVHILPRSLTLNEPIIPPCL